MTGSIGYYDAQKVTVVVGGVIITGFAEKTMVKCSKDENNSSVKYSPKGDSAVAVSHHTGGEIELTLMQTSPSLAYLNLLASKGTRVPAWVNSNNEVKEQYGGTQAIITKPADAEFSGEITDRKITIKVLDYVAK